jgi:hypothetical protein
MLVIKISVRFNMRRRVHSWDRARRCTSCDSFIVRSARRRTAKNEWLPRGSLTTSASCKWHAYGGELDDVVSLRAV